MKKNNLKSVTTHNKLLKYLPEGKTHDESGKSNSMVVCIMFLF
jgi:hypothetical protein